MKRVIRQFDIWTLAWFLVLALAVYVAPHAIEHVKTSPAFGPAEPQVMTIVRGVAK